MATTVHGNRSPDIDIHFDIHFYKSKHTQITNEVMVLKSIRQIHSELSTLNADTIAAIFRYYINRVCFRHFTPLTGML